MFVCCLCNAAGNVASQLFVVMYFSVVFLSNLMLLLLGVSVKLSFAVSKFVL